MTTKNESKRELKTYPAGVNTTEQIWEDFGIIALRQKKNKTKYIGELIEAEVKRKKGETLARE